MTEQYDYRGTAQSRMYDWLVTREGSFLALCLPEDITEAIYMRNEIEEEDLEYIRGLVERDNSLSDSIIFDDLIDTKAPKARSGGVDYYDPDGPNALPEPLGAPPSSTRAGVDAGEEAIDAEA